MLPRSTDYFDPTAAGLPTERSSLNHFLIKGEINRITSTFVLGYSVLTSHRFTPCAGVHCSMLKFQQRSFTVCLHGDITLSHKVQQWLTI